MGTWYEVITTIISNMNWFPSSLLPWDDESGPMNSVILRIQRSGGGGPSSHQETCPISLNVNLWICKEICQSYVLRVQGSWDSRFSDHRFTVFFINGPEFGKNMKNSSRVNFLDGNEWTLIFTSAFSRTVETVCFFCSVAFWGCREMTGNLSLDSTVQSLVWFRASKSTTDETVDLVNPLLRCKVRSEMVVCSWEAVGSFIGKWHRNSGMQRMMQLFTLNNVQVAFKSQAPFCQACIWNRNRLAQCCARIGAQTVGIYPSRGRLRRWILLWEVSGKNEFPRCFQIVFFPLFCSSFWSDPPPHAGTVRLKAFKSCLQKHGRQRQICRCCAILLYFMYLLLLIWVYTFTYLAFSGRCR